MPKNRKAKKKLQTDFAKVRHKVGRKVPAAANATNTDIKSKRIALPGAPRFLIRRRRLLPSRGTTAVTRQHTHCTCSPELPRPGRLLPHRQA